MVGAPDLATRTVRVRIVDGGSATQTLTFTNKDNPPPKTGLVKVCKYAGPGVRNGTPFTFTFTFTVAAGTGSVQVKAGSCSSPQEVPLGPLTEKATIGLQVSKIEVDPQADLVGQPWQLRLAVHVGAWCRVHQCWVGILPQMVRPLRLGR